MAQGTKGTHVRLEGRRQCSDELAESDGHLFSSLTWKDDNLFCGINLDDHGQLPLNKKKTHLFLLLN